MCLAWSYCQVAGFVDKRKANQLEQFKKKSLLVHKENNKLNVQPMF